LSVSREIAPPETIKTYLRDLDDALRGPRDWKRRVLAETEDGLRSELDLAENRAECDVVLSWGPVEDVAPPFNESGCAIRARRMAWHILQYLPILVVGWALVVRLSPDPWAAEPTLIWWVAPLLFASTVAAIVGSVQLVRRSVPSGGGLRGVVSACAGVGMGVLCLAVLLCYRLVASHWHVFWLGTITTGALTLALLSIVGFHGWHLRQHHISTRHGG